ncbi:MAG: hypothetical protein QOH91_971 [Mycobacterium sp.]|nr:hypothetical protein [Mycobacterium sp.]
MIAHWLHAGRSQTLAEATEFLSGQLWVLAVEDGQ